MKRKDLLALGVIALIAAIISLIFSSLFFKIPGGDHNLKVTTADSVSTTFPDIHNDPAYTSIFNSNALDPAQPVQIDNNQNKQPFNGGP